MVNYFDKHSPFLADCPLWPVCASHPAFLDGLHEQELVVVAQHECFGSKVTQEPDPIGLGWRTVVYLPDLHVPDENHGAGRGKYVTAVYILEYGKDARKRVQTGLLVVF